jgi:hypothetical protein
MHDVVLLDAERRFVMGGIAKERPADVSGGVRRQ